MARREVLLRVTAALLTGWLAVAAANYYMELGWFGNRERLILSLAGLSLAIFFALIQRDRFGADGIRFAAAMPRRRFRNDFDIGRWIVNTGTQRHLRAPAIVVMSYQSQTVCAIEDATAVPIIAEHRPFGLE